LLELNSFNPVIAAHMIEQVRLADADPFLRDFLSDLLDHFGVRIKEHEEGDVFLDPSHAYVEGFPSIPHDGMLATFNRQRAITREDIRFISADHSLVRDALDLLIDSKSGTTAFGRIKSDKPNLLLETIFVLEAVADSRWHVDQFLASVPVRVVVDVRGNDLTNERDAASLANAQDGTIQRFLERPSFNLALLKTLIAGATGLAEVRIVALKSGAQAKAGAVLAADLQRLTDLRKINDHVRPDEIALAKEHLERVTAAIGDARLRLDSIRLVVEGPLKANE
jgi:ATP-dependent helicase HepA